MSEEKVSMLSLMVGIDEFVVFDLFESLDLGFYDRISAIGVD